MERKEVNESIKAIRKIVRTTIELKKEILWKQENGVCVSGLTLQFSLSFLLYFICLVLCLSIFTLNLINFIILCVRTVRKILC